MEIKFIPEENCFNNLEIVLISNGIIKEIYLKEYSKLNPNIIVGFYKFKKVKE